MPLKPLAAPVESSTQPDPKHLDRLLVAENACFALAGSITAAILCGWLLPAFGSMLPQGWALMKANTAAAMLLAIANLILTQPKRSDRRLVESRICAVVMIFLAGTALLEYMSGRTFAVDTLLAADAGAALPGRMSIQTACFLVLMGSILLCERTWYKPRIRVADLLTLALVMTVLVIIAGYVFGAANLFGQSTYTRTSPQTLLCIILLGMVIVSRSTYSGFFSVLVGVGIGSQIARMVWPFTLMLPFLVISAGAYCVYAGWLSAPYAAAIATSTMSIALLALVVLTARKINGLERDLRDMSLIDELTRVHNRRGFYLLGEHVLREGKRTAMPLTVLYFDLDGLKRTNDTLGHDVGSQLVLEFASLLRSNFRGSDVVARLGGDEFAVVLYNGTAESALAMQRLDLATEAANTASGKAYRISYCVGEATTEPAANETFSALVARADAAMYERKQQKRIMRDAHGRMRLGIGSAG